MVAEFSRTPERVQIAVVGAGVAGLSAATFLRARGFAVAVFERQPWAKLREATEFGNGIHLYFHCARMLVNAGLPLRRYLTPLDIQMRRDDGKMRSDISRAAQLKIVPGLAVTRASVYSLLRQQLYKLLTEHVPSDSIHCAKSCTGVIQRDDCVELNFTDGSTVVADFVVGADGIHSVLADQLLGARKLNKHDVVIVQGTSGYDGLEPIETWILHRLGGTMGLVPVVLPEGRAGTFWWISLPSSELDTLNRTDLECYRSVCKRYTWDSVHRVAEATDPLSLERWHSQDKAPLRQWFRGRVALLGDACHAATPFSGYGAGMAIEDAYWLASSLRGVDILDSPRELTEALNTYQSKRAGQTAKIVREARSLMHALHPRNRIVGSALNAIWSSGLLGPLVARKFIAVFQQGLADTDSLIHKL